MSCKKALRPASGFWPRGTTTTACRKKRIRPLALLDKACPQNPLVLQHQSGHVGVFNSPALKALGVDETTPSPDGGRIEQKDGRLTGYMEENAVCTVFKKGAHALDRPAAYSLRPGTAGIRLFRHHHRAGRHVCRELIPLYQALLASNLLKLDVVGYADIAAKEEIKKAFAGHIGQYKGHFKLGGYKIFLDGSPQGRTAWMRAPYSDEEEYCGYPF